MGPNQREGRFCEMLVLGSETGRRFTERACRKVEAHELM